MAETDAAARVAAARGLRRWEGRIRDGLRAMHARGDLPASTDPEDLALATLAALQGGLLLTQLQRDTRPLEVTLDANHRRLACGLRLSGRSSNSKRPNRGGP